MENVFTWKWLRAALVRALKTVAQTAAATIGTAVMISEVDWRMVVSAALLAGGALIGTHMSNWMGLAGSALESASMMPFDLRAAGVLLISSLLAGGGFGALLYAPRKAIIWGGLLGAAGYLCYWAAMALGAAETAAMFAGALLFVSGLHFPEVPRLAVHAVGSMIGPLCMIVTGMLIGSVNLRRILAYKKLPLIVALRLLVLPLLTLLLFRASGLASWTADGSTILLISFLAAAAPCASTVTQMSHLYGHNGEYASLINVVSTLLCVITMPVMVFLFQL